MDDGDRPKKLARGVKLILRYPSVAYRTCQDCENILYSSKGEQVLRKDESGTRMIPLPRTKDFPTPCGECPKTEGGKERTRRYAIDVTGEWFKVFWHYKQCKAVGRFPKDLIVVRNAAIVEHEIELAKDEREAEVYKIASKITSR